MTLRCARISGFTLVEMLVVMVLLSLVALGLVSAMQTMGRAQDRLEQRLSMLDERQVTMGFVSQVLGRLSDRRMAPAQSGQAILAFRGKPLSIEWLGIFPARPGMGGRYWMRLSAEQGAHGGLSLVLRYEPWQGEMQWPDWSRTPSRILVEGLSRFEVVYGGGDMPPQQWSVAWGDEQPQLPTRISLSLATADHGEWPLWIIRSRELSTGGARASRYSTGPGR